MNTPDRIRPRSITLDVRPIDRSAYEETVAQYLRQFSGRPGVRAIGTFGGVGTPGVSDIDLLVVCDDDSGADLERASDEFRRQSPLREYLFRHDVYVIPVSGVGDLLHFHPCDSLTTLWGDQSLLAGCRTPDEAGRLLRTVLWNSSCWGRTAGYCGETGLSLRSLLVRIKAIVMSALHNCWLMPEDLPAPLPGTLEEVEAERREIVRAGERDQGAMAVALLHKVLDVLVESDRILATWLGRQGLVDGGGRTTLRLSEHQVVVCEGVGRRDGSMVHRHASTTHETYLPSFYQAVGALVAAPFLTIEPSLARLWRPSRETRVADALRRAADRWQVAFRANVDGAVRVGLHPFALHVYPFNVRRVDSPARRYAKRILGARGRTWLRARIHP